MSEIIRGVRFWIVLLGMIVMFTLILAVMVVSLGMGELADVVPMWSLLFGCLLIIGGLVELFNILERRMSR